MKSSRKISSEEKQINKVSLNKVEKEKKRYDDTIRANVTSGLPFYSAGPIKIIIDYTDPFNFDNYINAPLTKNLTKIIQEQTGLPEATINFILEYFNPNHYEQISNPNYNEEADTIMLLNVRNLHEAGTLDTHRCKYFLFSAVRMNNLKTLKFLLDKDLDQGKLLDSIKQDLFKWAVNLNHRGIALLLLHKFLPCINKNDMDFYIDIMLKVIDSGDFELLDSLIENGANVDSSSKELKISPCEYAVTRDIPDEKNRDAIINLLFNNSDLFTQKDKNKFLMNRSDSKLKNTCQQMFNNYKRKFTEVEFKKANAIMDDINQTKTTNEVLTIVQKSLQSLNRPNPFTLMGISPKISTSSSLHKMLLEIVKLCKQNDPMEQDEYKSPNAPAYEYNKMG